jgi:CRISPR-associated protein Cas1
LAQSRRVFDAEWCAVWANRQIRAKTRAQIRLLDTLLNHRADMRKPLTDALSSLHGARLNLAVGIVEVAQLRGLEGAAARAYFQGLSAVFPPSLEFSGRNRRPPRDPVNACLSLGYTLLHFDAVSACHIAGLDPLLGFYHRPSYGRESLASDLIEPLRPHLDHHIWQLFRERDLREDHFTRSGDACLMGKAGRTIFYRAYEDQAAPARRMLLRQCRVLAKHLKAEGEPLLQYDDDDEVFS